MKIGVFDSGVGGLSVANAIKKAMPDLDILLREDKANLPYGDKTPDHLFSLVLPILNEMINEGCQVIVVACNTVTTTIIDRLRASLSVPLVGIEPMVKPACHITSSRVISVMATPTTLSSERYATLKKDFADGVTVVEPDCSQWSRMIEDNAVNEALIEQNTKQALDAGADVIVLACTHYHWIEDKIINLAKGKAVVLQPEQAVIERLRQVIEQLP